MKRNEWSFEYTAAKLAEAAEAKRALHYERLQRLQWWEEKKVEVTKQVGDRGIEVHDSVASGYSNTATGIMPMIQIDSGLQRDLCECQNKIQEHGKKVRDYAGWVQVLRGNPEARLSLEHDDYLFFFGE